jgi:hypothetical protein
VFPALNANGCFGGEGAVITATLDDVTKKIKPEPTAEEIMLWTILVACRNTTGRIITRECSASSASAINATRSRPQC